MTRQIRPKRWASLLIAGTAAGIAQHSMVQAATEIPMAAADLSTPWMTQTSGESGEAGESGVIKDASPDVAYITRLGLVEGHVIAAQALFERGMTDAAIGLAGHPEAEMMDEVRDTLEARRAPDFSDDLENIANVMIESGDPAQVAAAVAALHMAIDAAIAAGNPPTKARFDSMLALTRAAANAYEGAIKDGVVEDEFGYHESYGFLKVAEAMARSLSTNDDATVAGAAERVLTALTPALAEFGDMSDATYFVGTPSVIHGAAARIELAGLRVN